MSTYTVPNKSRPLGYKLPGGQAKRANGTIFATYPSQEGEYREQLYTEGHPVRLLGKKGLEDIGGPFFHYKIEVEDGQQWIDVTDSFGNHLQCYQHVLDKTRINNEVNTLSNLVSEPSEMDINGMGTTAIARCNPVNPTANVAAFLGETLERTPSLFISTLQSRASFFKSLGSDYLNVEFGWKPFVADLKEICYAITHQEEILKQWKRDAGKLIRRGYTFPVEETVTEGVEVGSHRAFPSVSSQFYTGTSTGNRTYRRVIRTKKWFSGAFVYHTGFGDGIIAEGSEWYRNAQHLLGISLTPDVLWQITPWSWLTDWFWNFGDILTNVRAFAFDGLVMPYGYAMWETVGTTTYRLDQSNAYVGGKEFHGRVVVRVTMQKRVPATPFGFDVSIGDLSPRQIAILAALGMSRIF